MFVGGDGHGDEVEAPDGAGVGQPPAELHQVGLRQDRMEWPANFPTSPSAQNTIKLTPEYLLVSNAKTKPVF